VTDRGVKYTTLVTVVGEPEKKLDVKTCLSVQGNFLTYF